MWPRHPAGAPDRKSTRLNSSHRCISYAVFCLKKKSEVRKAKFGFVAFRGDLKDNVGAIPLGLVFDKVKLGIRYMPYDFLARRQFRDPLGAAVKVLVVELKFSAELVGVTLNFFRPPPTNVVDGVEDLLRSLVYRKGRGEILLLHD